jgi:hypothetical protein
MTSAPIEARLEVNPPLKRADHSTSVSDSREERHRGFLVILVDTPGKVAVFENFSAQKP